MKRIKGFTLLEVLIALALGAFLFAGILSSYSAMRANTRSTISMSELQENARIGMMILRQDLEKSGFWGINNQVNIDSDLLLYPNTFLSDCFAGRSDNNRSFPSTGSVYPFRYLYSLVADNQSIFNCINDAKINSDIVQFKKVLGDQITDVNDLRSNRYYLMTNGILGAIISGASAESTHPNIPDANYWLYQHIIYYISSKDSGTTLKRKRLIVNGSGNSSIDTHSIVDGIEQLHFQFGLDINGDNKVDSYLSADQLQDEQWDSTNSNSILSIKIYLLAKNLHSDANYINNNQYVMGDKIITIAGDNYRRLLISSTIQIENAAELVWYEGIRQ